MAGWIVSATLFTAGFLFVRLVRKNSVAASLLFGAALFTAAHFAFDTRIEIKYTIRDYPDVYLLIDQSASCNGLSPTLGELIALAGGDKTFYFADTISQDVGTLNPEFSLVFDAVRTLGNKIAPGSKIVTVSDFLDNSSIGKPEWSPHVYPLVYGGMGDTLSIYSFSADEYIQGGEPAMMNIEVYSDSAKSVTLVLSENGKAVMTKQLALKPGINPAKIPHTFQSQGYKILGVAVNGGDTATNNNSLKWAVNIMPSYYKLLVVAGRPSEEYAALKRFLDKIRWISPEYAVLKSKEETYSLKGIDTYNAIILLDLSGSQLEDLQTLSSTKKKVFYQPGVKKKAEAASLLEALGFDSPEFKPGETKFLYNGQELVVKTGFANTPLLFETAQNIRIFLGWDTWKWDFLTLAMGIDLGIHSDFWRNQLNFLIGGADSVNLPDKLNYVAGSMNPAGTNLPGVYTVSLKGQTHPVSISLNPAEHAGLPPDVSAAKTISSNLHYVSSVDNWKEYFEGVRGNEKLEKEIALLFMFRNNPVVFFVLLAMLTMFWILKDTEEIKR
ncbi:MAG: hypothetical protein A2Y33_02020 [Spirochaetes bacterium GWF1_51_8]|nr:MAG: hypothetical protein A2Y33_02020 [Spirochaetes bacterium GWF1_51_8]